MPRRELSDLKSQSITGRRHQLDEFNLEDVVGVDLAIKGHLRFIGAISGCIFHGNSDGSGGSIRARSFQSVQFLELSKG